MNDTTERPEALEDFYSAVTDWYDIDAHAYTMGLDHFGLGSAAFKDRMNKEINFMRDYNEARDHASTHTAARWLAVINEGTVTVLLVLWLLGIMIVALAAMA